MLDLLVFAAVAAAVVVAILALLKVMIEFPGMGDWCLKSIHKRTEKNSKSCESRENSFEEIIIHDTGLDHLISTRGEKTDPTSSKSVSRTSTETEMFKRRFEEIDEILSAEQSGQIISTSRLQEIRAKTNFDRRHSSHDQSHRTHHQKHHHKKRRHSHSHSHDPHRHHRRHHQHHHHNQSHHHHHHHSHHQNHSSNTDVEYDNSPSKSRSQNVHSSTELESVDCSPRRPRQGQTTSSPLGTQERINQMASPTKISNNMRININNVNILINRHTQKDVTINIDMEDTGEVEAEEEHHDEVRSSDSGIGWDLAEAEHQEQDTQQASHQMEPVSEELERNVIVESSPSLQPRKEAGEESPGRVLQLESLPKRFRHNTYS